MNDRFAPLVPADLPHEIEIVTDGIMKVSKWNDGRIYGYLRAKDGQWLFATHFDKWDEGYDWYMQGEKKGYR